jgi:hypothetical protein
VATTITVPNDTISKHLFFPCVLLILYCKDLICYTNRIDPEGTKDDRLIDEPLPSRNKYSEAALSQVGQQSNQGMTLQ